MKFWDFLKEVLTQEKQYTEITPDFFDRPYSYETMTIQEKEKNLNKICDSFTDKIEGRKNV